MGSVSDELTGTLSRVSELKGSISAIGEIAGSISSTHTISGSLNVPAGEFYETYDGSYDITPSPHHDVVLPTANKVMNSDVSVFKIPYFETSNTLGYTVYIGGE